MMTSPRSPNGKRQTPCARSSKDTTRSSTLKRVAVGPRRLRPASRGAAIRWGRARSARHSLGWRRMGARSSSRALAIAVVAVAVLALAPFSALLGFDAEGGDGACFQALDADLLAGLEAVAVRAVLDALQRVVDLADQLAFPVARAQLEAELFFLGGAVVGIGEVRRLVLHVRDRAIHLHHEVALPAVENEAEVLGLLLAHVLFAALDDVRLYVARTGQQAPRLDRLAIVPLGIPGGARGRAAAG